MQPIALPHSDAAEQALIGRLLLKPDEYELLRGRLKPEDFFVPIYADMFKAIGELLARRMGTDPLSVAHEIAGEKHGPLDSLAPYFSDLISAADLTSNLSNCAYVVADYAYRRRMIILARAVAGSTERGTPDEVEALRKELAGLTLSFSQVTPEMPIDQVRKAFTKAVGGESMMKTGFAPWDDTFGGLFRQSRYIIAGHAGVGKSALAGNLAWNIAKAGNKVRWVSFEETTEAIWHRVLARELDMPITSFRKGLSENQQVRVIENQGTIAAHDFLVFNEAASADPGHIANMCGKCDLIVFDGITSAPCPPSVISVIERAAYVVQACKTLSFMTGATVIMLGHVNSEGLKGSSSIASLFGGQTVTFDAEGIVELRWADATETGAVRRQVMNVLKNRYGAGGNKVNLTFEGERMRYGG